MGGVGCLNCFHVDGIGEDGQLSRGNAEVMGEVVAML